MTIAAESHQPDVLRQMVELGLGWTVLPGVAGPVVVERAIVLARRDGGIHDPAADALATRLLHSVTDDS